MASSFQRVRELFEMAVDLPRDEQLQLLDRECKDHETRSEVEQLLRCDSDDGKVSDMLDRGAELLAKGKAVGVGGNIANFRLCEVLGSGGMGTVYEAEQDEPRRRIALKVLSLGLANEQAVRRFRWEAEVLGRLRHPNIAQIHAVGVHRSGDIELPWFAMELVPGARDLLSYAKVEVLSQAQRIELMLQVCDAVHHGHLQGVVHRDLKPQNLLVDDQGRVKVIDFGIARSMEGESRAAVTEGGIVLGTLHYMSPEQLHGREIDLRSDIFSLGIVLFELLTGRRPFVFEDTSPMVVAETVSSKDAPRLGAILRGADRDLEVILQKALRREAEGRYASALEFAEDLRAFLDERPVRARAPSTFYQVRMFARRRRGLVSALSVIFGLVVTALIVVLTQNTKLEARDRQLTKQNTELEKRGEQLAQKNGELQRAGEQLAERNAELALRDQQLTGKNAELEQRGSELAEKNGALERAGKQLEEQNAELERRRAELARKNEELLQRERVSRRLAQFSHEFLDKSSLMAARGLDYTVREALDEAAANIEDETFEDPLVEAELRTLIGETYTGLTLPDVAEKHLRRAEELYRQIDGDQSKRVAVSCVSIAIALREQGRNDDAQSALQRAQAAYGEVDEDDEVYWRIQHNCAYLLRHFGRLREAEALFRKVITARERLLGEDDDATIISMHNLGTLLLGLRNPEEARDVLAEAVARCERAEDHPLTSTLQIKDNLAEAWRELGEFDRAAELHRYAMDQFGELVGPDHHITIGCGYHLLKVLYRQQNMVELEALSRDLLDRCKNTFGESDYRTMDVLSALAASLSAQGKHEDAVSLQRHAFQVIAGERGAAHTDTMNAGNNLMKACLAMGDHEQALETAEELQPILDDGDAVGQMPRPVVGIQWLLRAQALLAARRFDDVRQAVDMADQFFRDSLPEGHPLRAELRAIFDKIEKR